MAAYEKCKKCGENTVHLAMAYITDWANPWAGHADDNDENPSRYADKCPPSVSDSVGLFARICFECGELVDVGIETPRDKVIDTSTRKIQAKVAKDSMR